MTRMEQYPYPPFLEPDNVIHGRRFEARLLASGLADTEVQPLARAEDSRVKFWQITLSPIFEAGKGPTLAGMPVFDAASPGLGNLQLRMGWGGGGVRFETEFRYPTVGSSFCIAGSAFDLAIRVAAAATVFTEQNKPAVVAWAVPVGRPTSDRPISINLGASVVATPVPPWTRQVVITKDVATDSVQVLGGTTGAGTATIAQLTSTDSMVVIPWMESFDFIQLVASTGFANAFALLAFT